ncbi:MAG: DUF1003 domain-containing protein [Nostoc sp. ZfuVER08]|jgi:uncharacterized membrane protein|uniref:DUF1003 domain-containing protein n=1 Tax=Nostoc punctiforme FACHB-252 TaxID=1357509 RepID=A0ABR8H523_NOSPU|nr:DUF1003 domain-containing protein [Nostoc punctiforme]MBD2610507.1 DUF1003 domain-containing protein [Nostoc punctiforme FACHB-252]MBL1199604.1 DUF1003 domain-containing protein [Nostoc sp. GBBB01]MDZ8010129.1 DUF1003 domain-containing protein [Nostoc sp. ZfuVER08]
MNTLKPVSNKVDAKVTQKPQVVEIQPAADTSIPELTFGQRLADKFAAQVGSWGFLIGQSTVLAGWVGINLMPGVPHWDESPFMMLNLVFSFASAYTAPIVLMSQNRQSDTDRKNSEIDHQVNLRAGQNIELLHEKLDDIHTQQLNELTQIIKEQQRMLSELKVTLVANYKDNKEVKMNILPGLHTQSNAKFTKESSSNKFFVDDQQIGENNKVVEKLIRQ